MPRNSSKKPKDESLRTLTGRAKRDREIPLYEADDGPLSCAQIAEVVKLAADERHLAPKHMRSQLFKS